MENELLIHLLELLSQRGYPDDALVVEPSFGTAAERWLAPDLVVVDPDTREHLAIFEFKKKPSDVDRATASALLESYAKSIQEPGLQLYLATEGVSPAAHLQIYQLRRPGLLEPVASSDFPTFAALRSHRQAAVKDKLATEQRSTSDSFTRTCRVLGGTAFALFVADAALQAIWKWQLLTFPRLALLGVAATLLVLPYAAKFKGLGIEWERHFDRERGDS